MTTQVYSFANNKLLINGAEVIGFDTGDDAIVITPQVDRFTSQVGAGGDVVYSLSEDNTAEMEFKLQSTSPFNLILTGIFEAVKISKRLDPLPIALTDLSGNNLITSSNAVVAGFPVITYGTNQNPHTWKLLLNEAAFALSGVSV